MNLREAFLAASKPPPKKISVDGIDTGFDASAEIFIRVLTVGEILDQQNDTKDGENRPAIARAFARVVCDADNQRVYDPLNKDDIAAVLSLPWMLVRRIMEQANIVNGLTPKGEDAEAKK